MQLTHVANGEQTLRSATTWVRYAEFFAYDEGTHLFSIANPSHSPAAR
jgi:hypothetical protein